MQKNIIKIFIILIIYILIRELFLPNFSFNKKNSSWTTSSKNNFSSSKKNITEFIKPESYIDLDINDFPEIIFPTFKENTLSTNAIYISVNMDEQLHHRLAYYIPLIKPIKLNHNISYAWNASFKKGNKVIHGKSLTSLTLEGHIIIYGFCSSKKTKLFIDEIIEKEISENSIRKKIIDEVTQCIKSIREE